MLRVLLLILCLLSPAFSPGADAPPSKRQAIEAQIAELRAQLHHEADALEEEQDSNWWDLVKRRRREARLRRLRSLQARLEDLEKNLSVESKK
jgi:hypothetical protein